MGTQRTTLHIDFLKSSDHNEIPNVEIDWTLGSKLAFPDIQSRNVTVDKYQNISYNTRKNLEI